MTSSDRHETMRIFKALGINLANCQAGSLQLANTWVGGVEIHWTRVLWDEWAEDIEYKPMRTVVEINSSTTTSR